MPLIRKDIGTPTAATPHTDLRSQLFVGSADERWSAARQLSRATENADVFAEALKTERDPRVREALFTGLAQIRTPDAVAAVLTHLRSDDASIRTAALDALNVMSDAIENYIPELLADPDPDIRLLVCDTVRRLPSENATRALCLLLENETAPNVCAAAVEALSEVGDAQALPVLARCVARFADEPFLVFSIRVASNRIGRPPAS